MAIRTISDKEFNKLSTEIIAWTRDNIFLEMWKCHGRMIYSDRFSTAWLEYYAGAFRIAVNPKFWKKLDYRQKTFIICHEFLHLILGHWNVPGRYEKEWLNIAQDLQVNEYLESHYPELSLGINFDGHATIKSVFKHHSNLVETGKNYLYYYDVLMRCLV